MTPPPPPSSPPPSSSPPSPGRDRFRDREEAGTRLAALLVDRDVEADLVVGVPRGGLPVAAIVAKRLSVPLDVVVARKVNSPWNPELGIAAVASDGSVWENESLIEAQRVGRDDLTRWIERERDEASAAVHRYRRGRPALEVRGEHVVVVDDGAATGATTIACIRSIRNGGANRVTVALPVCPPRTVLRLREEADDVVCVLTPSRFSAVGEFYDDFGQVTEEHARALLEEQPRE